jgi:phosphoribosylformylglycinamidine cyclo-ligase
MSAREYLDRGVSPSKEDVHRAIAGLPSGLFPGAFCRLIPDMADPAYVAVLHADGAGTKSAVAYIAWRETGDASVFAGIAQDSAVMNLDDMICVGACDRFQLSNTIGRNAHRMSGDVLEQVIQGYARFAAAIAPHGVAIEIAGGETADVGDLVQTIIVDSTMLARLPRERVIDCSRIRPGAVIVGLSSSGQAVYESAPNSGIGSNGLTVARHVLLHHDYAARYPETFSKTLDRAKVYGGTFHLGDRLPGSELSVGQAILSPTRTYAPIVRALLERHREAISGIIHCSGGGQTKCKHFGKGLHYVKHSLFDPPPLFRAIRAQSQVPWREMFEIFNMGHRMEIYCDRAVASDVIAISERFGVEARVVGEVRENAAPDRNAVTLHFAGEELVYG